MTDSLLRTTIFRLADVALLPIVFLAALPMRIFRRVGAKRLPLSRGAFRLCGYWPLRRHYYDPLIDPRDLSRPLDHPRDLSGIDWNTDEQLRRLRSMHYQEELAAFLVAPTGDRLRFRYDNQSFVSGDADYLYSFVRATRPRRVVEVGCGSSTLLISAAIEANRREDPTYDCAHTCIEPYEQAWLEELGVRVLRVRVEHVERTVFDSLESGDLLFIDSSHIIRPCGDVLLQVLEILPRLASGVYVHFHDIFSPRHYPSEWIDKWGYQWNEQYLVEAFMSFNREYRVVAALNYLQHNHFDEFSSICASHRRDLEPGSLYLQRN